MTVKTNILWKVVGNCYIISYIKKMIETEKWRRQSRTNKQQELTKLPSKKNRRKLRGLPVNRRSSSDIRNPG
eukprot:12450629-Heterocapsa_arctica.AAC.1